MAFIEGYATKIISGSNNKDSKKIAWVHIDLMENPWTEVAYHSLEEEKECYQKYDNILGVSEEVVKAFEKACGKEIKYWYGRFCSNYW